MKSSFVNSMHVQIPDTAKTWMDLLICKENVSILHVLIHYQNIFPSEQSLLCTLSMIMVWPKSKTYLQSQSFFFLFFGHFTFTKIERLPKKLYLDNWAIIIFSDWEVIENYLCSKTSSQLLPIPEGACFNSKTESII